MVSQKESQTFCLALSWISIGTKSKVMSASILFADCQHFLESIKRRGKKKGIVRVPKNTKIGTAYPATTLIPPQLGKEIVHIEAVSKTRQDRPLADTVSHTKERREIAVPSNVSKLIGVDEDEDSNEYWGEPSTQELPEQDRMLN